jgi:serine/threonine protein phosphatase PrpC
MCTLQHVRSLLLHVRHYIFSFLSLSYSYADNWPVTSAGFPSTAGTTASVAFLRNGKLYTGHCGDSGIVMGYENARPNSERKWLAHPLTIDHKPESIEERRRIEACGGKVMEKQGISRVVWFRPKHPHSGPIRRNTRYDEIPFLAVGRSLGDLWSFNKKTNQFMVSPEPDVAVFEIDSLNHKCLIFGTDGLWNMIDPQQAVDLFYECERINADNKQRGIQNWRNPARHLVEAALTKWQDNRLRSDNTTVICIAIDANQKKNPNVAASEGCTRTIYDYSTNEAYNLDYIDPYHMQNVPSYSNYCANQSLPSFSNVNYTPCLPSTSTSCNPQHLEHHADLQYYPNTSMQSGFVKSCCLDQRFVLASNNEEIHHHESYEHHKQVYESMTQKKFPPLHYAYKPISIPFTPPLLPPMHHNCCFSSNSPSAMYTERQHMMERYNYIRPSDEELERMHREPSEEREVVSEEERQRRNADTPIFDSDDDEEEEEETEIIEKDEEEMDWSDSEDTVEGENNNKEASKDENSEAETCGNIIEPVIEDLSDNSIQIFEISSSNLGINDKKSNLVSPTKKRQPDNKENSEVSRKRKNPTKVGSGRIYQTRQMERRTRSTRVIGRENLQKRVAKSMKKLVKTLNEPKISGNAIVKKLEPISTNVTTSSTRASTAYIKNKENNNSGKSLPAENSTEKRVKANKVDKRVLRSSQTEMKETSAASQQKTATAVVSKVVNIVRNLRSHANQAPAVQRKVLSLRRKTIKVK